MDQKIKYDMDYRFLRKMVLQGKMSLADAKIWVKAKGDEVTMAIADQREKDLDKNMSKRANRQPRNEEWRQ